MTGLNNKIHQALQQIHAEQALKNKTKAALKQKIQQYEKQKYKTEKRRLVAILACLCLLLIGGAGWFYFTPATTISIDINPSLEVGVNFFDRVVSVESYNDDGQELAASLDIRFMTYAQAIQEILETENITDLLSADEILTISVIGSDEQRCRRILSDIESYTAGQKNIYCYSAASDEVATAHEIGLSYGKYRAFLELQSLDPDITPEELQHMTMREIRDLIDSLSGNKQNENASDTHQGAGNGHGQNSGGENRRQGR